MSSLPVKAPDKANIRFNEFNLPVSTEFDDIYFNNEDGLAESRYVFLQHNDLPERWQTHSYSVFRIAESGFGTGLNFLASWALFAEHAPSTMRLHFVSFEKYPLAPADMARALQHFPELAAYAKVLINALPSPHAGCHRLQFDDGRVTLDLWYGDIHDQLPQWLPHATNTIDAWFLDGFAPDKNPQMWQPELYNAMAQSCREHGSFATFTAAGAVRRGLQEAGFAVAKVKGFGRKRDMLRGVVTTAQTQPAPHVHGTNGSATVPITIIGGGIAAACLAWSLCRRGFRVELLTTGLANGASGNAQGAVYPLLHAELSPLSEFFLGAFDHARQFYQQHSSFWHETGVVQLAFNATRQQRHDKIIASGIYHESLVRELDSAATQALWNALPAQPALLYPRAGWVPPEKLVQQLFAACGNELRVTTCAPITAMKLEREGWQLSAADGSHYHAHTVIVAAGAGSNALLAPWQLNFQNVRGQVTQVQATDVSSSCNLVVCYKGYFTPPTNGLHCVGATYAREHAGIEFDAQQQQPTNNADRTENLATLQDNLQQPWTAQLTAVSDRAALRHTTRDHLPACGWLTDNLGVLGGLGSRGFTSAPLCAEILVGQWLHEPLPLGASLLARLAPQRLQDVAT
ncbi:bifunctional tRNA (5-methylaminomethyl-2-thiouridine)(34)-methyltransferase MnmD/FAD-dependent 5-carboxymethylaminomethyl-2-thiouridine(34) oxidoreductase MnmC [Pseudidiomarina woesei]|uniref:bifunctional tRNA (5-methylaminomethyl-2-thiouridine)(34)-methyltransferase MnmD/FAD-dependent 5-carboxymethylaminomethyl-2-thiouridine(34) oxidoreductase MnmC n=1 Tax=Pseudidiomarina woesei TaxID=1381080 RepID=UPI0006E302F8|nr:bifunctional tRNA (5-methylaminomethyl-2-thiouridine)(34)-methyltransferase MnmD/FAD-dependent 5-carboxymethylaminomethyl-2-thiouridine(34) oxidoreductase MnmC [Pseudidiomarina woesei]